MHGRAGGKLTVSTWNVDESVRGAGPDDHVRLLAGNRLQHERVSFGVRARPYELVTLLVPLQTLREAPRLESR